MSAPVPLRPPWLAFATLAALTAAEMGVAGWSRPRRGALVALLIALAVAKAAVVLLSFMDVARERRALKITVLVTFLVPAALAVVLMKDAIWRLG